jgi:hypothetical protein
MVIAECSDQMVDDNLDLFVLQRWADDFEPSFVIGDTHARPVLHIVEQLFVFFPGDAVHDKSGIIRKVFHRFKIVLRAGAQSNLKSIIASNSSSGLRGFRGFKSVQSVESAAKKKSA